MIDLAHITISLYSSRITTFVETLEVENLKQSHYIFGKTTIGVDPIFYLLIMRYNTSLIYTKKNPVK